MSAPPVADDAPVPPGARRLVIAGLMLAMTLPAFDLLILSTAGKDIVDDLGGSITWMFIAYQTTLVASMPLQGKLGDLYGRKASFQVAVVLFVAASMLAGAATSPVMLLAGRALQGVAGGGILGQSHAVLADIVSPRERGRVAWIVPAVWTVAAMTGPLLGGLFVDHLSWRWIFFIYGPAGAVAFVLIGLGFQVPAHRVRRHLDVTGSLLTVAAVGLVAAWISLGGEGYSWRSPGLVLAGAAGLVFAVALVGHEWRAAEPVFPLRLLGDRVIGVCTATTFFIGAANFGMAVFLPLFLRVVTGISATEAGLSLLPVSIGIMLASTVVGRLVARTGAYRWYPLLGSAVFGLGIYHLSNLDHSSAGIEVWIGTFLAGTGSGIATPVLMLAMQNAVGHGDVGSVSSLGMFSRSLGQVLGPAIGGSLMAVRFEAHLHAQVGAARASTMDASVLRTETSRIEALQDPLRSQVEEAFGLAVNDVFALASVFAAAAVLVAAAMRARPLRESILDETADAPGS